MMGWLVFMVDGHMACTVHDDSLMVRINRDDYAPLLEQQHVGPMPMSKRPNRTFVLVANDGLVGAGLARWVGHGLATVATLPPK